MCKVSPLVSTADRLVSARVVACGHSSNSAGTQDLHCMLSKLSGWKLHQTHRLDGQSLRIQIGCSGEHAASRTRLPVVPAYATSPNGAIQVHGRGVTYRRRDVLTSKQHHVFGVSASCPSTANSVLLTFTRSQVLYLSVFPTADGVSTTVRQVCAQEFTMNPSSTI